ncbi:MAG: sugar transferase [Actinomycetia bacterium]|nr:sugar transferase [Actinomycetes bacterium]
MNAAMNHRAGVYLKCKRVLDVALALLGLLVIAVPMLLIAALVASTSHGGALYRQKRLGLNGKEFTIYKFRTMIDGADARFEEFFDEEQMDQFEQSYKIDDDPRVTKFGRFLRRSSLDELPQIFNVIKGDMSFVGPRPVTDPEISKFGTKSETILSVRPGITGYWAIKGRSNVAFEERVELEHHYVCNISLWMDAVIFINTFRVVVQREGAK